MNYCYNFFKVTANGILLTLVVCVMLFLPAACVFAPDDNKIDNQFLVGDNAYDLSYGTIHDYGTNYTITGRYYKLKFRSSQSIYSTNYLHFKILSSSTTRLQEGTYYYNDPNFPVYDLEYGYDLVYDATNEIISGKRIPNNSGIEGFVSVSRENDNYVFDFDFDIMKNEIDTIKVNGHFTDLLYQE